VGIPGLEPGTSSLSGCRRSGSDNGFTVVSWAYGRTARFSCLAVSCAYTRGPWRSRAVVGPALGPGARSLAVMAPSVRIARPGDGAGISRVWLDASAYYAELEPGHFKVPDAHGLAELTESPRRRAHHHPTRCIRRSGRWGPPGWASRRTGTAGHRATPPMRGCCCYSSKGAVIAKITAIAHPGRCPLPRGGDGPQHSGQHPLDLTGIRPAH
jgi:hypothetical protein